MDGFLGGVAFTAIIWGTWVVFHPYKCRNKRCGYWTFFRRSMFHHVQNAHFHRDYR